MMVLPESPLSEPDPQESCRKFWSGFQQDIRRAECLLEHNMHIIAEINNNHSSKATASLPQNALLTKELCNNINKVVDLYASLTHVVDGLLTDQNSVDSSEGDNSSHQSDNSLQVIDTASTIKPPPLGGEH